MMNRKIMLIAVCISSVSLSAWAQSAPPPVDEESAAPVPITTPTVIEPTTMHWQVRGVDAFHATQLEGTLKTIDGVRGATVDWKPGTVEVECTAACPAAIIQQVLAHSGAEVMVR